MQLKSIDAIRYCLRANPAGVAPAYLAAQVDERLAAIVQYLEAEVAAGRVERVGDVRGAGYRPHYEDD